MRSSAIVLAGLSALALAAPVQKRAYVTDTVIDYVTVFVTEGNPPTVCIYLLFSSLFPFQCFGSGASGQFATRLANWPPIDDPHLQRSPR
ncbi:hypothetical protein V494_08054 [Pseudogymnoascus sp. VKM F-4513 (FW-928)]|nr:hypothetical protein V494_08054 [Pseudogymnoascus sp. VKM F-4513 (FW-928)]